jgi:hypothetical protein
MYDPRRSLPTMLSPLPKSAEFVNIGFHFPDGCV